MRTQSLEYVRTAQTLQAVLHLMHKDLDSLDAEVQREVDLNIAAEPVSSLALIQLSQNRLMEIEAFFSAACVRLGEVRGEAGCPRGFRQQYFERRRFG